MVAPPTFSAAQQALGYMYQVRYALLRMLEGSEDTSVLIEKDDDLDLSDPIEGKILASLKHKAVGDVLSDLSPDFWKSVRIWLARYRRDGAEISSLNFFLLTTGQVADGSFLNNFLPTCEAKEVVDLAALASNVLAKTTSKTLLKIKAEFEELDEDQKADFLSRITIFDHAIRIEDIPVAAMNVMRSVRSQFRRSVYERLEGWWTDLSIELMTGRRKAEVYGRDVSDKLSAIADQFKSDNLPIDFRDKAPPEGVDPHEDQRLFVQQLRSLDLKRGRIQQAILDYYRAFIQRSAWAREHVLIDGEVEDYEDRLIDEWTRYREIVFENLNENSTDEAMKAAGKELLRWAETNTSSNLRIRPSVSEPYVLVGSFHILANFQPTPKVHWHPQFIDRLNEILIGDGKP